MEPDNEFGSIGTGAPCLHRRRDRATYAAMSKRNLSLRAIRVLDALDSEFAPAGVIAARAGLPTRSRIEDAARLCEHLVSVGLAERQEGRWRRWRRAGAVSA